MAGFRSRFFGFRECQISPQSYIRSFVIHTITTVSSGPVLPVSTSSNAPGKVLTWNEYSPDLIHQLPIV